MKMEQTECPETLATKFHTPKNIPKENIRHVIISFAGRPLLPGHSDNIHISNAISLQQQLGNLLQ
jgi:hypothetical protein